MLKHGNCLIGVLACLFEDFSAMKEVGDFDFVFGIGLAGGGSFGGGIVGREISEGAELLLGGRVGRHRRGFAQAGGFLAEGGELAGERVGDRR